MITTKKWYEKKLLISIINEGFPGGSDGKESTCNVGDLGSIPGLERSPGGGHGDPLQYSCLENLHGHRNLAGYCPWGCKYLPPPKKKIQSQVQVLHAHNLKS